MTSGDDCVEDCRALVWSSTLFCRFYAFIAILPCQKTRIVMVAIFVVSPINQAYCKYESTCYKCSTYLSQAARTQQGGRQ